MAERFPLATGEVDPDGGIAPQQLDGHAERSTPEDFRDAYRRLANSRTAKAIRAIRRVQDLACYPHWPERRMRIAAVLRLEVDRVEAGLSSRDRSTSIDFDVDGD